MAGPVAIDAREAVLARLGDAHTRFVVAERQAYRNKRMAEAEGARRVATWLLRAYRVERDDPEPRRMP